MKKNYFYVYMVAALSIILPLPPCFAYGILAIIQIFLLVIAGLFTKLLLERLDMKKQIPAIILFVLTIFTILYKQLLILYSPVMALTIGYSLYLICFSSYVLGNILDSVGFSPWMHFLKALGRISLFSAFTLVFFVVRDILAFGSISYPSKEGVKYIRLFKTGYDGHFFVSIPGTLIMLGLIFALFAFVNRKIMIIQRSCKYDDV